MAKERKAIAVDAGAKAANLKRLRRIEGQVRGLQKMVEAERYCADVLMQISSVQEALRGVSRELMRNHLRHCVTHNLQHGKRENETYNELVELFFKHNR
jgi:DNA-binding FrmR family transcriptional regulator